MGKVIYRNRVVEESAVPLCYRAAPATDDALFDRFVGDACASNGRKDSKGKLSDGFGEIIVDWKSDICAVLMIMVCSRTWFKKVLGLRECHIELLLFAYLCGREFTMLDVRRFQSVGFVTMRELQFLCIKGLLVQTHKKWVRGSNKYGDVGFGEHRGARYEMAVEGWALMEALFGATLLLKDNVLGKDLKRFFGDTENVVNEYYRSLASYGKR